MTARIAETNKKPGVCYAFTDDGLELPVIDVTHPAFAVEVTDEQLSAIIEEFLRNIEAAARTPAEAMRALAAGSILVRGWMQASGTFMTGMMTYLNRLGPDNLGDGWANAMDRKIAGGLTPLTFRFRLRDVSQLLAWNLASSLAANPARSIHLINIGGGPAADSLNALILLHKQHPELVRDLRIGIQVLDLDEEGPHFGARSLAALREENGPLHGVDATLDGIHYDWTDPATLPQIVRSFDGVVLAGSSEGGLFDYGSDEDIVSNLRVLYECTPAMFTICGSVVKDFASMDPRIAAVSDTPGRPIIRYLGLDAFRALAGNARWTVERVIDSPLHHAVSLKKAP